MNRRRAVLLVVVLLLMGIVLVGGLALLARSSHQYSAASAAADSLQAEQFAYAGMESARVRIDKDPNSPPASGQNSFTGWEAVYDVDNTTVVGYYMLTVETAWQYKPYYTIRVCSTGLVGTPSAPRAKHRIRAELDINQARSSFFHFTNWQDDGSF